MTVANHDHQHPSIQMDYCGCRNMGAASRVQWHASAGGATDTAADSLAPTERGEGWGEGI
jgi:hypothetical protein